MDASQIVGKVKEMENKKDEIVAFGMTDSQVDNAIEALSKHKDGNHPSKSNSYSDFLDVVTAGHKALLAQKDYGKIN